MKYVLLSLILLVSAGCGGGGDPRFQDDNTVYTGSPDGALLGVDIRPAIGSYDIPQETAFSISWRAGANPPPRFTVTLVRYQEGYSYEGYDSSGNSTTTTVSADHDTQLSLVEETSERGASVWRVVPKHKLVKGGIYYLILRSDEDEWRAVFRVDDGRVVRVPGA